jgi:histidine phosphotransfer protein HptB
MMIDWERVKELRGEIGAEDFAEVAAMFLEEADEAVARLQPGLTAKAMEADLHFLKGAALNLGFSALSGLCQEGERRAAGGDTDVDLETVKGTYFASKAAYEAGVGRAFAA